MSDDPFPFPRGETARILDWVGAHIEAGPDPANGAKPASELDPVLGGSITREGLGPKAAFSLFTDAILPATRPFGHPTSLSFVAAAPTRAALSFDAALGAAGIFAGNWDGGAGAIHAENQALRWLSDLAGWPESAGGVFVAGGTLGNLSALHAARCWFRDRAGPGGHPARVGPGSILCSAEAHSSIAAVARVMDARLCIVPTDETGRMSAEAARAHLAGDTFAIVANGGATNCGAVDDLDGLTTLAAERGLWVHVDGAYGGAALADAGMRPLFAGLERAHSMVVDPHKWVFSPYDSCALIYRDARHGAAAHGQRAAYLDTVDSGAWNPSDYALHLTRRARGLPLWYSLATHGTAAYARAIARTRAIAETLAARIEAHPALTRLLGPQLTVILFRPDGMEEAAMESWAERHRRSGALLCLPTRWRGQMVFRLCIVNPRTDPDHVMSVLDTLG